MTPEERLVAAQAAFERGDFRTARAEARGLVGAGGDVDAGAKVILAALAPDKWARRWGIGALVLLALLAWEYVAH